MMINQRIQFYLNEINKYIKKSLMLIVKPWVNVQKIRDEPFNLKSFFLSILVIAIIHSILNFFVSYSKDPLIQWNIINIFGVSWQIFIFIIFVITFSPLVIDIISSRFSKFKNQFYQLAKVYCHILLIFALYPIVNIVLAIFNYPNSYFLPFSQKSNITIGQIIEGILICYVSVFIIYSFYKSKKSIILSLIIIGMSFPLILYGIDFVFFLLENFYRFEYYGFVDNPAHIILYCLANMWFCLLILFFGALYFYHQGKNILKLIFQMKFIPNFVFPFLIFLGYIFSGFILPFPQLFSLIIASIATWNSIYVLWMYYNRITYIQENQLRLNNWDYFMVSFWLITISFSFALMVSFISAFLLFICFIFVLFYLKYIYLKFSSNFSQKILLFFLFYLIVLIGSPPTFFLIFYDHSIIALEFPNFLMWIIAIPIAGILSISLKTNYFWGISKDIYINI